MKNYMAKSDLTPERIEKIKAVLDSLSYKHTAGVVKSAFRTLETQEGCCLEGALVANLFLDILGQQPKILHIGTDRTTIVNGQEVRVGHSLAVYEFRGKFGTIAKSRYPELCHRDPLFATPVELVIDYITSFQKHGYEPTSWSLFELEKAKVDWKTARKNIHELNREITSKSQLFTI
jgi:hypothetical protein